MKHLNGSKQIFTVFARWVSKCLQMSHTNSPLLKTNSLTRVCEKGCATYEATLVPKSKSHAESFVVKTPPPEYDIDGGPMPDARPPSYSEVAGETGIMAKCSTDRSTDRMQDDGREQWDKKAEFLLAVIGFAVDLGNVWRFPYMCYRNGGGAFLIPYVIMLIFGGLPLFYLELALGQYYRSGCLTVWEKVCPLIKGVGYAICIIDFYMAIYYNTIISWALLYLFNSFRYEVPWISCGNPWNTPNCSTAQERLNSSDFTSPAKEYYNNHILFSNRSTGLDDMGPIKWDLSLCLLLVFVIVYFSLWKGVKSSGKVVWVTAIMPYIVLFILLCRGITLDGSWKGIHFYLYPEWERLKETRVWIDAATQIFFSLGPGFGTLLALSSYNQFHNNCFRDAVITSSINCLTSFFAGIAIFSVLGHMALVQNKDVGNVTEEGVGLIFEVYPEALSMMTGSVFWSILFFIMLITLGLDSTFAGLEAMITGLCDEYPKVLKKHREWFVGAVIIIVYICALPTTTYGGKYLVSFLDSYAVSISILFVVFVESVAVCWIYGTQRFSNDIEAMLGPGRRPGILLQICWIFISPLFILVNPKSSQIKIYPEWSSTVGWLLSLSSLMCIPVYMFYRIAITPGSLIERLRTCIKPSMAEVDSRIQIKRDQNIIVGELENFNSSSHV
ncbi:Sodium-dependent serotonin transporter [Nymphon striatum]|nr:Sodium-dependent serotonin transporter [Nymphon striatum]